MIPISANTLMAFVAAATILSISITWFFLNRPFTCQKPTSVHHRDPSKEDGNLLIIDGCNGPIRFNNVVGAEGSQISLLKVVNGVNRGERVELLRKIDEALIRLSCINRAIIYFDGLGLNVENVQRDLTPWIKFEVTNRNQEVDDVIVDLVTRRRDLRKGNYNRHEVSVNVFNSSIDPTGSNLHDAVLHLQCNPNYLNPCANAISGNEVKSPSYEIYTVRRNDQGSGKSRGFLKHMCLLRQKSVFCIYGKSFMQPLFQKSLRDLKKLSTSAKKLIDKVDVKSLNALQETIVVTDDVYLRQRIVEAGGFVMTFEQLWVFLDF